MRSFYSLRLSSALFVYPHDAILDVSKEDFKVNNIHFHRYAFKLMYDEAVLGPIDDFEELAEYLLDYEDNWHMGNDSEDVWVNAVLSGTPNLLSLGYNKEDVSDLLHICSLKCRFVHLLPST